MRLSSHSFHCLLYCLRPGTDLDFADGVSLLASMLEIVVLALEILHEESSQLGLEINWSKTKIQVFDEDISQPSKVSVPVSYTHLTLPTKRIV